MDHPSHINIDIKVKISSIITTTFKYLIAIVIVTGTVRRSSITFSLPVIPFLFNVSPISLLLRALPDYCNIERNLAEPGRGATESVRYTLQYTL